MSLPNGRTHIRIIHLQHRTKTQFAHPPRPNSVLGLYAPRPKCEAHLIHDPNSTASSNSIILTALAHARNTMTLRDPNDPLVIDT